MPALGNKQVSRVVLLSKGPGVTLTPVTHTPKGCLSWSAVTFKETHGSSPVSPRKYFLSVYDVQKWYRVPPTRPVLYSFPQQPGECGVPPRYPIHPLIIIQRILSEHQLLFKVPALSYILAEPYEGGNYYYSCLEESFWHKGTS